MKSVAVLCAAKRSVYHGMHLVEVYDSVRDAWTFADSIPVVAHPPCRLWSAFCSHQAKSEYPEHEKALGVWCVDQVRRCGGVLEQPAHSRLFERCNLPKPGQAHWEGFSIEVPQYWFGDTREKNTWLWFYKITEKSLPQLPFRLKPEGGDRRIWQLMSSKNQRERTTKEFAEWLIECARMTTV